MERQPTTYFFMSENDICFAPSLKKSIWQSTVAALYREKKPG